MGLDFVCSDCLLEFVFSGGAGHVRASTREGGAFQRVILEFIAGQLNLVGRLICIWYALAGKKWTNVFGEPPFGGWRWRRRSGRIAVRCLWLPYAGKAAELVRRKIQEYRAQGYSARRPVAGAKMGTCPARANINWALPWTSTARWEVYPWLQANSYKYGFIFRYPGSMIISAQRTGCGAMWAWRPPRKFTSEASAWKSTWKLYNPAASLCINRGFARILAKERFSGGMTNAAADSGILPCARSPAGGSRNSYEGGAASPAPVGRGAACVTTRETNPMINW